MMVKRCDTNPAALMYPENHHSLGTPAMKQHQELDAPQKLQAGERQYAHEAGPPVGVPLGDNADAGGSGGAYNPGPSQPGSSRGPALQDAASHGLAPTCSLPPPARQAKAGQLRHALSDQKGALREMAGESISAGPVGQGMPDPSQDSRQTAASQRSGPMGEAQSRRQQQARMPAQGKHAALGVGALEQAPRLANIREGKDGSSDGERAWMDYPGQIMSQPGRTASPRGPPGPPLVWQCNRAGSPGKPRPHRKPHAPLHGVQSLGNLDADVALNDRAASLASRAQMPALWAQLPRASNPVAARARTSQRSPPSGEDLFFDFSSSVKKRASKDPEPHDPARLDEEEADGVSDLPVPGPAAAAVGSMLQGPTGHRDIGDKPSMRQPGTQLAFANPAGNTPAHIYGEFTHGEWPGTGAQASPHALAPPDHVSPAQFWPKNEPRAFTRGNRRAPGDAFRSLGVEQGPSGGTAENAEAWVDHPGKFISGPAIVQSQRLAETPKGPRANRDAAHGFSRPPPPALQRGGPGWPREQQGPDELVAPSGGGSDAGRFTRQLLASPQRRNLQSSQQRFLQGPGQTVPWSLPEAAAQGEAAEIGESTLSDDSPVFPARSRRGLESAGGSPDWPLESPASADNSPREHHAGGAAADVPFLRSHVSNPWPKGVPGTTLGRTDTLAAALEDLSWNPFHSQGFGCGRGNHELPPFDCTVSSDFSEGSDFSAPEAREYQSFHESNAAAVALGAALTKVGTGQRHSVSHSGPIRPRRAADLTPSIPPSSPTAARASAASPGPIDSDGARVPSFIAAAAARSRGRAMHSGQAVRTGAATPFTVTAQFAMENPGAPCNLDPAANGNRASRIRRGPGSLPVSLPMSVGSKASAYRMGSAGLNMDSLKAQHRPCPIFYDQERFDESSVPTLSLKDELALMDGGDGCEVVQPSASAQQGHADLLPAYGSFTAVPAVKPGHAEVSHSARFEAPAASSRAGHAAGCRTLGIRQPQLPPSGEGKGSEAQPLEGLPKGPPLRRAAAAGGSGPLVQGQTREERQRRRQRRILDYQGMLAEVPGTPARDSAAAVEAQTHKGPKAQPGHMAESRSRDKGEEEGGEGRRDGVVLLADPVSSRQGSSGEEDRREVKRDKSSARASCREGVGVIEGVQRRGIVHAKQGRVFTGVAGASAAGLAKPAGKARAWPLGNRLQRLTKDVFSHVPPSVLGLPARDISASYTMGKTLGEGQFGITRLVESKATGEKFACKSIKKANIKGKADLEDVKRECTIFEMLRDQPHVPRLHDTLEDSEDIHFVMELCHGGDLFERISLRKRYTEHKAACVMRTLLQVIQYCHKRCIVHRDIKPENILLCSKASDTDIKVIDFGIAAILKPGSKPLTELMGSPFYIAPEVIGGSYGFEADVWSSGIVLYVLLMGVPPFYAKTQAGILRAVREAKLTFRKGVPLSDAGRDFVCRLLDKDPKTRITTAEALAHPWLAAFTAPQRF